MHERRQWWCQSQPMLFAVQQRVDVFIMFLLWRGQSLSVVSIFLVCCVVVSWQCWTGTSASLCRDRHYRCGWLLDSPPSPHCQHSLSSWPRLSVFLECFPQRKMSFASQQKVSEMKAAFSLFDEDGSGAIDKHELMKAIRELGVFDACMWFFDVEHVTRLCTRCCQVQVFVPAILSTLGCRGAVFFFMGCVSLLWGWGLQGMRISPWPKWK